MATKSPFLRNLHRIRVLKVQYTSFLNLFWEQGPSVPEDIPLIELSIDFQDDPTPTVPHSSTRGFGFGQITLPAAELPKPLDTRASLQILKRSPRLSVFSFVSGDSSRILDLETQARLLSSLPASLKKLDTRLNDDHARPALVVSQEQKTLAPNLFLKLKKDDSFQNLTSLSMKDKALDPIFLTSILKHSPKLEELNLDGSGSTLHDPQLAAVLFNVTSPGWKTLGFKDMPRVGPLTVAAILQNSATLENLRLTNCVAFDSKSILKLLCSAPNLKRLDCIPFTIHGELEPYSLMAMDIIECTEDWVCLGLESFKCYVGGVPRPDIRDKRSGRRLTGIYNRETQYSMSKSSKIQRRVMAKLGRLTKLQEITLGKDVVNYHKHLQASLCEKNMEGWYYSPIIHELGSQYQCLTMSLQDGLDELKNLKCLRRLTLEKMSLSMGEAEQTWMKENWPDYSKKSRDTFWTSRGHYINIGSDVPFESSEARQQAIREYRHFDWW